MSLRELLLGVRDDDDEENEMWINPIPFTTTLTNGEILDRIEHAVLKVLQEAGR